MAGNCPSRCAMPTPEDIHPEFGYLAPKAPLRRNLRVGLIAGIVGLVLGGAAVMALAARSKPEVAKPEPTLAFASIDEVATAPAAASSIDANANVGSGFATSGL